MKIGLEKFSYRSGEVLLNTRTAIAREIDDLLLNLGSDIVTISDGQYMVNLSREEYTDHVQRAFIARGWDAPPPITDKQGKTVSLVDCRKEGIGIQFGFRSTYLDMDVLNFQAAFGSVAAKIDLGVYVVTTTRFQQYMKDLMGKHWSNMPWTGPTLQATARKLPIMARLVEIPICVIGLDVVEVKERYIDISKIPPNQTKDIVIKFLEDKYKRRIDRDVNEIGKGAEIGFDGIIRLDDMNIILAIELSQTDGTLRSKLLADTTRSLADDVRAYQTISGRKATLLFILVGDFSPSYIESVLGEDKIAHGWYEDIDVGYRLFSFDELSSYLESNPYLVQV